MAANTVVCCDCASTSSPFWRRRDNGEIICNNCHTKQPSEVSQEEPTVEAKSVSRPLTRRTMAKGDRGRARHHYQGKHSLNKSKFPMKSPTATATVHCSPVVFHKGVRYQVGDVVSLLGDDGQVYYCQLRGFLRDHYGQLFAALTWLLPKTPNPSHFDPMNFIIGPEDDNAVSLNCLEFVAFSPFSHGRGQGDSMDLCFEGAHGGQSSKHCNKIIDINQLQKAVVSSGSVS